MLFSSSRQDDNVIKPMKRNQHDLLQPLGLSTIQTVRRENHGPIQPTRICTHDLNQTFKSHTHDPTFSNGRNANVAIQPTRIHTAWIPANKSELRESTHGGLSNQSEADVLVKMLIQLIPLG